MKTYKDLTREDFENEFWLYTITASTAHVNLCSVFSQLDEYGGYTGINTLWRNFWRSSDNEYICFAWEYLYPEGVDTTCKALFRLLIANEFFRSINLDI